jgi:hypothetical protein
MGTDIYLCVEHCSPYGDWELVPAPGTNHFDWDRGRNYELFAMLANVRNRYDIEPISQPRGIPGNVSPLLAEELRWGGHSRSYHTVAQLLAYDWDAVFDNDGTVESYADAAGRFYRETLPELQALDPEPNNVRIVFWFDC